MGKEWMEWSGVEWQFSGKIPRVSKLLWVSDLFGGLALHNSSCCSC